MNVARAIGWLECSSKRLQQSSNVKFAARVHSGRAGGTNLTGTDVRNAGDPEIQWD